VGLVLEEILVDGCIAKAPGGGQCAGRSPVDRGEQGMKRSSMTDGHGIPLDQVLAHLADAIITVRSLIRQAWTTHRRDSRPARRP
jgi:hypothetical protein